MSEVKTLPVKAFTTSVKWHEWLLKNHANKEGIWMKLYKKDSKKKTITRSEALDEALCFGWIDGQSKPLDEKSWLQKYTPRRAKSLWSKINREHIARLTKEKRMQPAGLKEVETAKKDGRWDAAYDSPKNMEVPVDFLKELKKDKKAYEFYKTLNKANTFAIAWRLQTAKKLETRDKRMHVLLAMMKDNKKIH